MDFDPPGQTLDASSSTAGTGGTQSVDAGGTNAGGANGGSGGEQSMEPPAPSIAQMTPQAGPYGATVTLTGEGLGSAARPGVSLSLGPAGAERLLFPDDPTIVTWTENQISFRFPFPQSGDVVVTTPQGTADAGTFAPDWIAGPSITVPAGSSALAAIAPRAGEMVAAFDTAPVRVVAFDGSDWSESELDATGMRPGTLRLFRSAANELLGFALSDADPPEIVTFASDGTTWSATPSGVTVTTTYALAGGPDGATVWSQTGTDWSRARYTTAWAVDKGPIADPRAAEPNHAAGATSDGSLYIAWDQDTGNFLDDTGAPFMQQLTASASAFAAAVKVGDDVDDFVTSIELRDRGRGILIYYCGSDVDPFGLSETGYVCRTAARSSAGSSLRSGGNEGESTRYGVAPAEVLVAFCDDAGLHLAIDPAAPGPAAVWPCPTVDALEIDPSGEALPFVRVGDLLYSPRRVAAVVPAMDAGATDASD